MNVMQSLLCLALSLTVQRSKLAGLLAWVMKHPQQGHPQTWYEFLPCHGWGSPMYAEEHNPVNQLKTLWLDKDSRCIRKEDTWRTAEGHERDRFFVNLKKIVRLINKSTKVLKKTLEGFFSGRGRVSEFLSPVLHCRICTESQREDINK